MTDPAADRPTERGLDRAFDLLAQGQQAAADLVGAATREWTDAVRRLSPAAGPFGLPVDPGQLVDRFYDTGIAVLEAQRALAHGVLASSAPPR